jgi:hypothetical protein
VEKALHGIYEKRGQPRGIRKKEGEETMDWKGSQTEKNVLAAFAGESQARNRYTFFASKAKKEGYEQIAAISSSA